MNTIVSVHAFSFCRVRRMQVIARSTPSASLASLPAQSARRDIFQHMAETRHASWQVRTTISIGYGVHHKGTTMTFDDVYRINVLLCLPRISKVSHQKNYGTYEAKRMPEVNDSLPTEA